MFLEAPLPPSAPPREIWAYGGLTIPALSCGRTISGQDYGHSPSVNRCTQPRKLPGQDMAGWGPVRAANREAPVEVPLGSCVLATSTEQERADLLRPMCSQLVTRAALLPTRNTSASEAKSLKGKSTFCSQTCPQAERGLTSGRPGGGKFTLPYTTVWGSYLALAHMGESQAWGGGGRTSWSEPNPRDAIGFTESPWLCCFGGWVLGALRPNSNTDSKRMHVTVPSSWQREDLGRQWILSPFTPGAKS